MALQIFDRIKERIQTGSGTGPLTLLGAPTGFKTFSSRLSISDTTYYCIEGPGGAFEIGVGTLTTSTTLARTTVLKSSNSDSTISIGDSGQYFVFITLAADKAVYKDGSGRIVSGAAGIIFSDASIQTTAATTPDLSAYAPLASPTFTGTPAAPTATSGTNTTQLATTAFVASAVGSIDLTPYALLPDTLPAVGTLLSYGGSRQLAAGGTVTHSGALTLSGGSVSSSLPVQTITQTWNNAGVQFFGVVTDITSTASLSTSALHEWRLSGTRRITFRRNGTIEMRNADVDAELQFGDSGNYGALDAFSWRLKNPNGYIGIGLSGSVPDVQLKRNATGPAWVACAVGGLQVRNLTNSADAALTCGAITASGTIRQAAEITYTPTGTTQTITLNDGNHQTLNLTSATGAVTVTLTVPTSSSAGTIIVNQHASAAKDLTWAVSSGTIRWMGAEPDWAADAISSDRLVSWRWNGSIMRLVATDVGT